MLESQPLKGFILSLIALIAIISIDLFRIKADFGEVMAGMLVTVFLAAILAVVFKVIASIRSKQVESNSDFNDFLKNLEQTSVKAPTDLHPRPLQEPGGST